MENKKQDRALQTPSEANRDKQMNYLAAEEQNENADITEDEDNGEDEKNKKSSEKNVGNKHEGSRSQMLQQENLIDPGNEHNHLKNSQTGSNDNYRSGQFDADPGGDSTGTIDTKPGE